MIVLIGFAYATGFLIVSSFLGSYGIRDVTTDFLRLKYLQVGSYFFLAFGSVLVLTITLIKAPRFRHESNKSGPPRVHPLAVPIWIEVLVAIYLAVGFAEPQAGGRVSLPWVAILIAVSIGGSIVINYFGTNYWEGNKDINKFIVILYCALLGVVGWLGWMVIRPFWSKLWQLLQIEWLIIVIFALFMVVLGWLVFRGLFRRAGLPPADHKLYMWPRAAIGLSVYYLCVLSFAYGLYPFMSVSKGGGYYLASDFVRLTLRSDAAALPPELIMGGNSAPLQSKPLVLIEENSDAIFVADPSDPKNPPPGQDGPGGIECWLNFQCRPKVIEIHKADLIRIEHDPPTEKAQ